jgi:hypothetical protein
MVMLDRIFSFAAVVTVCATTAAFSQTSLENQTKALDLITKTAEGVCGVVKTAGSSQDINVKGDIQAKLNGLIKQLADIGVTGAANYDARQYEGFIQADLATAFQDNAKCKFNVFDKLQEKMIK